MRQTLFIILLGMFMCAKAQEHSVFLGIELGGDKDEFVDALEDK